MSNDSPTITLVGHCRPDVFAMTAAIRGFLPSANVVSINDEMQMSEPTNLFLVNRILDGSFSNESGIELIRELPNGSSPAILITNIEEHAQSAIEAGAVPGFGKANMRSNEARQALLSALNIERTTE